MTPDAVAELIGELLGAEAPEPDENVFEIGANSFTMLQLSTVLRERTGVQIPFADLIQAATPRAIADHLAAAVPGPNT